MSWFAVDDRFPSHRKVMRLRRSTFYPHSVALWTLAGSWCAGQSVEQYSGLVPLDVLASFGIADWYDATLALVDVELWERVDDDHILFHDWATWNGVDAKHHRSKEQARERQAAYRKRKCEGGEHDRHCPSETCPKRKSRSAGNAGSRHPGSGRVGSGREDASTGSGTQPEPRKPDDPWATSTEETA